MNQCNAAWIAGLCALALSLAAEQTAADPAGTVAGLQMPAWLERDGVRRPLRAGQVVQAKDRIITGPRARLLLKLYEGSNVKLGENGALNVPEFSRPASSGGPFTGFLNVVRGAFRFTTTLLSRRHKRQLNVRVAALTIGIRGTDVWGKAGKKRDVVCLIDGKINVRRGDEPEFEMSDPLTFYIAPKGKPALPPSPVSPEQLAKWATQTDLTEGQGIVGESGAWRVHLLSYKTEAWARKGLARVETAGFAADVVEARVDGETRYRVGVPGFVNIGEARGFAARAAAFGFAGAWADRG